MRPGEPVAGATVAALAAGALALLAEGLWGWPRCGTRAAATDAEVPTPRLPVVVIEYRCPDCHRVILRQDLTAWNRARTG